jgi:hypothetical protein
MKFHGEDRRCSANIPRATEVATGEMKFARRFAGFSPTSRSNNQKVK